MMKRTCPMNYDERFLSTYLKRWETSVTDNLRLAKIREELLVKAAQLDRDTSVHRKSEFLSLSKLVLSLGSVLAVAYGVIRLVLV